MRKNAGSSSRGVPTFSLIPGPPTDFIAWLKTTNHVGSAAIGTDCPIKNFLATKDISKMNLRPGEDFSISLPSRFSNHWIDRFIVLLDASLEEGQECTSEHCLNIIYSLYDYS